MKCTKLFVLNQSYWCQRCCASEWGKYLPLDVEFCIRKKCRSIFITNIFHSNAGAPDELNLDGKKNCKQNPINMANHSNIIVKLF